MKTWHKIGIGIAILLALASWIIALYYWPKLPAIIPTHFGISGAPDAWNDKSIWYSFLMPGLQTVILGLFIFLYYKPEYSDMPTTLWLTTLSPEAKEHAFDLIRTMLVGTALWIGTLFTYMSLSMNASAITKGLGLNPWIVFGLVAAMIIWLIWWTVKVYNATRKVMKGAKNE